MLNPEPKTATMLEATNDFYETEQTIGYRADNRF